MQDLIDSMNLVLCLLTCKVYTFISLSGILGPPGVGTGEGIGANKFEKPNFNPVSCKI